MDLTDDALGYCLLRPNGLMGSLDDESGPADASVVSRARSHGGKAKTNFPTPTKLHLDAVNIANMNNAAKLAATTNISNSHSSTVESSSLPSPRPLDLTLKTPLLSTDSGYFTAASGFRLLPASRELSFRERSPRETCRFDHPPSPTKHPHIFLPDQVCSSFM
ncbi:uncharacterized protein [Malus domestica]|uniref:uncharacterized protein n=1 Tax=Malus domestica TaxID=3750 RepID=UPI0010AA68B7|nr:uncharacterized protein LOC114825155 [Malus domestica]